ncbi:phytanoyl-CoA dioxygenase family protein [Mycolicibacterium sp. P9-64]|uniref:phytanoyl-CoA dioxygenase family protein n=1 Tax=Mycolicibacterium sp. P9-64 TaxID=2024612 RepID=UPI0015664882|nr:phytanoyl-CoA dioxygenase family protein [Mycolicibacterium sp. P9-64]
MNLETLGPERDVADVVAAIERDGACIVRDVLSPETLGSLDAELTPLIDRTEPSGDEWAGRKTKRTGGLVAQSPAVRPVVMHPLVLGAANAVLGPFCERIQLNLTQLITILPGQAAQPLHRDRFVWGGRGTGFEGAGGLPRRIEPQFNAIYALTDFTTENGATTVAPGSHRWDFDGSEADREAQPAECVQAEMSRGSVVLYTGSVIHAGAANRSSSPRIGMNITYSLAWLRQEENQFLSCPPDVAKHLDPDLADLLGYTMGNFALGFCTSPEFDEPASRAPETVLGRQLRVHAPA